MTEEGKPKPAMGAREWGLLIALSVVWGGSFFFVEVALADFPPFTLSAAWGWRPHACGCFSQRAATSHGWTPGSAVPFSSWARSTTRCPSP
jgi:hypothetical protein